VIAPLFHMLEGGIKSYGIIILVLVLIVKTLLFPLTYRSYKSMATMKALKPELDELKEKYGDDPQKIQMKSMEVYRSFGVNPLAGCVPMLAQMPVFLALYNFFPNAIELRKESFLWADDLSSFDAILSWTTDIPLITSMVGNHISLFTLLWCASMILQAAFNAQIQVQQQPGPMQYLPYIMPVMLLFVFNSFAAGLTFYYFVSNLITVGQQWGANKFLINQEKIRRVLEERKAKRSPQSKTSNKIDTLKKARGKKKK
jgi:YidC/Oxa1 family membrane protein insertase